ncbi:hypothetical protein GCM10023145_27720 [Angustibacter luteus]
MAGVWASYERDLARARTTLARTAPQPDVDLCELATKYGTDKWGIHRYAQHYQRHLEHLRDRPIRLLEIGVGGYSNARRGGASLRMWRDFFPQGQVVGMDIHDKSGLSAPRIAVVQADQSDPTSLRRVHEDFGPFDVIIDDGSHVPAHVRTTFETLYPLLAENGVYAIEDLQTSYWESWGGATDPADPTTSMALVKALLDGLNYEEQVDAGEPTYSDVHVVAVHGYHNLVVIEKGINREGTHKESLLANHKPTS